MLLWEDMMFIPRITLTFVLTSLYYRFEETSWGCVCPSLPTCSSALNPFPSSYVYIRCFPLCRLRPDSQLLLQ